MKKVIILLALCMRFWSAEAQVTNPENTSKEQGNNNRNSEEIVYRRIVGANASFQLWNNTLFVEASPYLAYKLLDNVHLGIGTSFQYWQYAGSSFSNTVYGGRVFGRFYIRPTIFAHLEYESLNTQMYDNFNRLVRNWKDSGFIGGGWRNKIGERGAYTITILYNALYTNPHPIYNSPLVTRIGFEYEF